MARLTANQVHGAPGNEQTGSTGRSFGSGRSHAAGHDLPSNPHVWRRFAEVAQLELDHVLRNWGVALFLAAYTSAKADEAFTPSLWRDRLGYRKQNGDGG